MKYLSLEPFIPSGSNMDKARLFFQELGFKINWDAGDYVGFESDACRFILQNFDNAEFAQNLMVTVQVDSVADFRNMVIAKNLKEKFNIHLSEITQQPYGKEVNIIDMAGVCWHFVES